jgi:transcriptional regulator
MPRVELLQGTLDLLLLQALTWGPLHGYEVSRWIRRTTDNALAVEEGALYPALHRLESRGWLTAEWGVTDQGRRAKYYTLTRAGRQHLRQEAAGWTRYVRVVDKVFQAART